MLSSYNDCLGRAAVAYGLRELVKEDALDMLHVPQKVLAHIPQKEMEFQERNYLVIAEKLELTSTDETKEMMQNMEPSKAKKILKQLFHLMIRSGYQDGHFWNFAFIKTGPHAGKLAIYDTEPVGIINDYYTDSPEKRALAVTRSTQIECGMYAINEALDPEKGLPFPKALLEEVGFEALYNAEQERDFAFQKAAILFSLPIATALTSYIAQKYL